jgi:hypothetical protein
MEMMFSKADAVKRDTEILIRVSCILFTESRSAVSYHTVRSGKW